jgi:addiction module HigA family antidote
MKNNKILISKPDQAAVGTQADDGLVGNPDGTDIDSEGYQKLQDMIRLRSEQFTAEEKREIEFNGIRYQMMEYLRNENTAELLEPGFFIRRYLKAADIKQNAFASFIHAHPGNLGKLLNGTRKIKPETAIILGNTFKVDPKIWLYIQDKNEMLRLTKVKRTAYNKYTLDNLIATK